MTSVSMEAQWSRPSHTQGTQGEQQQSEALPVAQSLRTKEGTGNGVSRKLPVGATSGPMQAPTSPGGDYSSIWNVMEGGGESSVLFGQARHRHLLNQTLRLSHLS